MHVIRGRAQLQTLLGRPLRAPAVAIGNFDGVHRGHQTLLAAAVDAARALGGEAGALTFDPHPARHFAPRLAPPMLTPLARKLELLAAAGLDFTIIEPFDAALAGLEAEPFVTEFLVRDLGIRHVVVGYDFSFGKGRRGDTALLATLTASVGVGLTVVPQVKVDGVTCSSTKVREFVLEGRMEGAALVLGRPFELEGRVVQGAARGRQLGYPTANLELDTELLPRTGIYAARAHLLDGDAPLTRPAAVSVGTNPTFGEGSPVTVEPFLLDFQGDLYGRRLRLEMVARLRDERRFDTQEALIAQIDVDVAQTRALIR